MNKKIIFLLLMSGLLFNTLPLYSQDILKAQVGVKVISGSGTETSERAAITYDRVKAEEALQIFIYPEKNSILYLIHSDESNSSLLKKDELSEHKLYVFPSEDSTYTVDGKSSKESIIILITPGDSPEIDTLFGLGSIPNDTWQAHESKYESESKIIQGENPEERISMAGNVRGVPEMDLKLYLGNKILIKKFTFHVKI